MLTFKLKKGRIVGTFCANSQAQRALLCFGATKGKVSALIEGVDFVPVVGLVGVAEQKELLKTCKACSVGVIGNAGRGDVFKHIPYLLLLIVDQEGRDKV